MAKIPGLNTWLNRATRQFLRQISSGGMEEKFPAESFHDANGEPLGNANWIHAPDMSPVTGVPPRYWIITGDTVSEMDAAAKAVVDAAALTASRDSKIARLDSVEDDDRQILNVLIKEFNILRALHGLPDRTLAQLRTAIRNGYGT